MAHASNMDSGTVTIMMGNAKCAFMPTPIESKVTVIPHNLKSSFRTALKYSDANAIFTPVLHHCPTC